MQSSYFPDPRRQQIAALFSFYPLSRLIKQTPEFEEFAVPLNISVSPQPLYVAVLVPARFPSERPSIRVLAEVTHPNISPDFVYTGKSLQAWNSQSVLIQVV